MTPAELDRWMRMQKPAQYDADGKCLHARAYYVEVLRSSMYACPDCRATSFDDFRQNDAPTYRCAGGCDRVVSSSPALCLSCAAHTAAAAPDAPGVGASE